MNVQAGTTGLERLAEGLFASAPQELGFAPGLVVRSFLIKGDGNLLIHASEGALASAEAIEAEGGAGALWLGHWHEAGTGAAAIAERLGAPVVVHRADRAEAERSVRVAADFEGRRQVRPDLEAIPIPGHTPGSTAYLWRGAGARWLFTADSLYLRRGALRGALLESSDREAYLVSLEALKSIAFDRLVPWVAEKGAPVATRWEPEAFGRELDAVIARLRDGGAG